VDVSPRGDADLHVDVGEASVDAGPEHLDLTPREVSAGRSRRWPAVVAVVVIVAAIGFILFQGLGDATLYFHNADEAVAMRDELGDRRFRLQGTVVPESVTNTPNGVDFTVIYHDVEVDVRHTGEPPDLFQEDIPVVVEGAWANDPDTGEPVVETDRIIVKHTEVYEEDNSDRLREAETEDRTQAP
jgi:cytochrome c-type biogenesis protein CcmE